MKVIKLRTVYQFDQKPIIKDYIDFNTNQRKLAKTDFEKNLYKLLNNALYGKTIENVRNHVNIDLISIYDEEKIMERQSKLSFDGLIKCYDEFIAYKFKKSKITFKQPIYLGFSILELSKLLMYEYYYEKFQPYWQNNLQLCYMDTDSFILSIRTNDIIKDLKHFEHHFDFSDLDKSHPLYDPKNKKVIGKLKLETAPYITIDEFIALRAKSYAFLVILKEIAKQKGIQKLDSLDNYKNCLFNNKNTNQTNFSIRSEGHSITVHSQRKLALNSFDDKRLYINNIT